MKKILSLALLSVYALHASSAAQPQPKQPGSIQRIQLFLAATVTQGLDWLNIYRPLISASSYTLKTDNASLLASFAYDVPELKLLFDKNDASPEALRQLSAKDAQFAEALRGICAVKCYSFILCNNHKNFTAPQKQNVLTAHNLDFLHKKFNEILPTAADKQAVEYAVLCNDLGKAHKLKQITKTQDHDKALARVFALPEAQRNELLVTFSKLNKNVQTKIERLLAMPINLAQLGQLESVPAEFLALNAYSKADLLAKWIETLCDVAGACGHLNLHGSMVYNEKVHRTYVKILEVIEQNAAQHIYQAMVAKQATRFGYITTEASPLSAEQYAYTRIASMTRCDTSVDVAKVAQAFEKLDKNTKENLLQELTQVNDKQTQIKIEYQPSLLQNAEKDGADGLKHGLMISNNIYKAVRSELKGSKEAFVIVQASDLAGKIKNNTSELASTKIEVTKINEQEFKVDFAK